MSGYSSIKEAQAVIKASVPGGPKLYNMSAIYREVIFNRGTGYGYSVELDQKKFLDACNRNLRNKNLQTDTEIVSAIDLEEADVIDAALLVRKFGGGDASTEYEYATVEEVEKHGTVVYVGTNQGAWAVTGNEEIIRVKA